MKTTVELTAEVRCHEDRIHELRRRIWQGDPVPAREAVDVGMSVLDYLCKLSGRIEKERNRETAEWLQNARRSLRSQLKQFWLEGLEGRQDSRSNGRKPAEVS